MSTTYKYFSLIFLFTVFFAQVIIAQHTGTERIEQLKALYKPAEKEKTNHNVYLTRSTNEIEATAAIFYSVYKNYISTQDMGSCVFHPSCSTYAIESLQNDNPLKAYLKVFDRLTRCHTFSTPGQYKPYKNTGLLYDPIK